MTPRDVYKDEPERDPEKGGQVERKRTRNRERMRETYTPRSEMDPETLAAVRAAALERQKRYLRRKRERMGLPPIGKPGRPPKNKGGKK